MSKSKDKSLGWEYWEDERDVHGVTENAVFPKEVDKENYQPRTLVDQTLEIIDPTPNVYTLFTQFNERFFWDALLPVQVKWSPRMTSCAGICTFHPRNRECIISLSAPLLKLRPRKDLVETLLHEMIHGYLFLTNNNRDRDGHGPEFCKHMKRINQLAGTNITIYHSFHDEVRLYQQHWWRCNGPCQKRAPFFGTVRRAMNRAPGPSDSWWKRHEQSCNGQFIKIKEPEKAEKSKAKKEAKSSTSGMKTMDKYMTSTPKAISGVKSTENSKVVPTGFFKLGTDTNRVHGFGTGGPGSSSTKSSTVTSQTPKSHNSPPAFSCSGTLGGANRGKSNLLDKFFSPKNSSSKSGSLKTVPSISLISPPSSGRKSAVSSKTSTKANTPTSSISLITPPKKKPKLNENMQNCPICNICVLPELMNPHLDECLLQGEKVEAPKSNNNYNKATVNLTSSPIKTPKLQKTVEGFLTKTKKTEEEKTTICNICNTSVKVSKLYDHLDVCLKEPEPLNVPDVKRKKINDLDNDYEIPRQKKSVPKESEGKEKFYLCLVCNDLISKEISLEVHLEACVTVCFNDSDDESSPAELPPKEGAKFPCPVCTELIAEKLMNSHLDECIK